MPEMKNPVPEGYEIDDGVGLACKICGNPPLNCTCHYSTRRVDMPGFKCHRNLYMCYHTCPFYQGDCTYPVSRNEEAV